MVRPGKKTAIFFLGSFALAQILWENNVIDNNPFVTVYVYSALARDLMMLWPDHWEDWVLMKWERGLQKCAKFLRKKETNKDNNKDDNSKEDEVTEV